ncbi:MAG: DNA polymerase, partial [Clostridia bacterium]
NYMKRQKVKAHRDGQVVSIFGRIRRLPLINNTLEEYSSKAERQSINAPIQGAASDLCQYSLSKIEQNLLENNYKSIPVITVHDSILVDCPSESEVAEVENLIEYVCTKQLPQQIVNSGVPIVVDMKRLKRWGGENLRKKK